MRTLAATFMKFGISAKGRPERKALEQASQDVQGSQHRVLADILEDAAETVYGREHSFGAITTVTEYQKGVPVNRWEDLRPYAERHEKGEADVLFAGRPLFYATTSGTTSDPKRIPITPRYYAECYNGLTNLWLHSMLQQNPGFMNGFDLSMVGKAVEGHTADGTPYGSLSGQLNTYMPDFVKKVRVVPFGAYDIDDYFSKYYTLLRVTLGTSLRWIVAPNPSTLLELARFAADKYDELIKDIRDGTLWNALDLAPPIRAEVEARLRPDPKRAAFLEGLASGDGVITPQQFWPDLRVVSTWKSGNAAIYLRNVRPLYPERTVFREFGYIATEARAGIVLDNRAETSILAAHKLFFEFVPAEELQNARPTFLQCHELENGREYGIYITTPGGLYRYDMNDIVKLEGFHNQFPMVRFVQKGAGVTSLTGEKLYESQYLRAVANAVESIGAPAFHIGFADLASSAYHCFLEFNRGTAPAPEALAWAIDAELQAANVEYRTKRQSNRLASPQVHLLLPGAYRAFKASRMRDGMREGQFKLTHLKQDDNQFKQFYDLAEH